MRAAKTIENACQDLPDDSQKPGDLMQLPDIIEGIAASARMLRHDGGHRDASTAALAHLQRVTGIPMVALFQKKSGTNGRIVFDWHHPVEAPEVFAGGPAVPGPGTAELIDRMSQGQAYGPGVLTAAPEKERSPVDGPPVYWLVLPIHVGGDWWGGLCFGDEDTRVLGNKIIAPALDTIAQLLGVFFERLLASRDDVESDKLAGALDMAGTVCHKLNQPMQVILGYASMVSSGDITEPDQVREIVKMIEDETRRMGIITKNLMGITKFRTFETPDGGLMGDIDPRAAHS
jgi:hypothetical protein